MTPPPFLSFFNLLSKNSVVSHNIPVCIQSAKFSVNPKNENFTSRDSNTIQVHQNVLAKS